MSELRRNVVQEKSNAFAHEIVNVCHYQGINNYSLLIAH